jgi:MoxR-like ATPase
MELERIKELGESIKSNISKVIVGKDEIIELVVVSLLCTGHVLLEYVPGTGKTMMAKCLAKSIDCQFKRIQFTPDLLPTDLTGLNYFNQKESEFKFRQGPIFANIVLADEINRATPRTQASLLECMEERQVTIDGETKSLKNPFFVIATQNPVETHGTFPLPEAQLDRFFMKLNIGYPSDEEGISILDRFQLKSPLSEIKSVAGAQEIVDAQASFPKVKVSHEVKEYIIKIIGKTRNNDKVSVGVSPRGSLAMMKAAQVYAILKGRDYVMPDDIKHLAIPVLSHRLVLNRYALTTIESKFAESVILNILKEVPVPLEEF